MIPYRKFESIFRVRNLILAFVVASVALTDMSDAAEGSPFWPQFHGPNRDNISSEGELLSVWPENGPDLVWTTEGLGHGFSTVSIADGQMYTAGNIGDDTVVTALDLKGTILWQVKNGKAWTTGSSYPGTRGTPTVDGNRVFHESPLGNVICLDAKIGKTVWELNVLEKYNGENIRWALAESLLIDGEHVICSPGGPDVSIVALDKHTGEVAWEAPSTGDSAGYASPILFEHGGLRILTTLTAKSIIGVNADTGALLWRIDHESYTDQNTLTPIFHDGHLFISTIRAGSIKWKVQVSDGTVSLEEVWRTDEFDNHHGGVVLAEGNIYGASITRSRNRWVCLDWETGEIEYVDEAVGKGSVTYADGLMYMLSINRVMGLVRPLESGYEMVSTFNIPEGGEGKSWAHPVVAGGHLYIRHGTYLYAYDIQNP
ncbi:MAG: PQQ-binding-like beta-propeller repeat protein [Candidatus Hydrogenedentota bacterium]